MSKSAFLEDTGGSPTKIATEEAALLLLEVASSFSIQRASSNDRENELAMITEVVQEDFVSEAETKTMDQNNMQDISTEWEPITVEILGVPEGQVLDLSNIDVEIIPTVNEKNSHSGSQQTQAGGSPVGGCVPFLQSLSPNTKFSQKRKASVDSAKKQSLFDFKNKRLRLEGKGFQATKNTGNGREVVSRPAKAMKSPCKSTASCRKSSVFACAKLSEQERQENFTEFWSKQSWEEKKTLVTSMVDSSDPKRCLLSATNTRNKSYQYFLKDGSGKRVKVCLQNFANTFGTSKRTIQDWISTKKQKPAKPKESGNKRNEKENMRKAKLKTILKNLPSVESHYCRQNDTNRYLEPNWPSLRKMYRWYKMAEKDGVCWETFLKVMKETKTKIFKWKKDRCSYCEEVKLKKEVPVVETEHFQEQKRAFQFKRDLKKTLKSSENEVAFAMDVQQVLPVPKLSVGASFFRLKMYLHNFTFWDLETRDVDAFLFSELDAGGCSNVFASCIEKYLEFCLQRKPLTKKITIISDSCLAQNKNTTLSNCLLNFAITHEIIIEHFYMVVGHTHMECDTFHSAVESSTRNSDIYDVDEYAAKIKDSRVSERDGGSGNVKVHVCKFDFFKKYEHNFVKKIRPGNKTGDPTVAQTRAYRYLPEGKIEYKMLVNEDFRALPQTIKLNGRVEPSPLYQQEQTLSDNKLKHLSELMAYVPVEKRSYFDSFLRA